MSQHILGRFSDISIASGSPRVSVIMPFLNAEQFIEEAIQSVLAQTFTDWELLLIDDGSSDGSTSIAQTYAQRHGHRVRYLEHEGHLTRGASASRNLGLTRARGEYVAILDADDIAEPTRLKKQVAYMNHNPEVALLGSWYREINSSGKEIQSIRKPCAHLDILWNLLFYSPFLHSSVMFRKNVVLAKVGGYDESLSTSQDYELWTRIARHFEMANLREYLVRYRVHDASLTSTRGAQAQVGHRMRVATVSDLMGWGNDGFADQERRLERMSHLIVGAPGDFTADDVEQAIDHVFRLHTAFCRQRGLEAEVATKHRAQLRARVSTNLVVLAASCGLRHHKVARKLLRRAHQLYPLVLFSRQTLARSCKRVI